MAFTKGGDIDLPIEYMSYIPKKAERRKYFDNILNWYKRELPGFKLLYAYLAPLDNIIKGIVETMNANYDDTFHLKMDYLLIFEVPSNIEGRPIIVIENPLFGTDKSTIGFQYCLENDKLDVFKSVVLETATRIPYVKFIEFIYLMAFDELYESYEARNNDPKLKAFYDRLPIAVKAALQDAYTNNKNELDDALVLDANAKPFKGALSMNPGFWKSPENMEALLCNSIILSAYYVKPQK